MANPNFTATMSSNEIWYGTDSSTCLTDVVDSKADANHAHAGYAEESHTHDGYASSDHAHTGYAAADHTHAGYAAASHTHEGYAAAGHTHEGYAADDHSHALSDVEGLSAALNGKANAEHAHAQADVAGLAVALEGKANASHTHTGYAAATHTHDYAASGHTHTPASIGAAAASHSHTVDSALSSTSTNPVQNKVVQAALAGKAATSHTHDYAASGHTHTPASIGAAAASHTHDYLPTSGGAVNGDLNVVGVLRVKGQQAVFDNGERQTFGSGNREHYAIGTKLYCNQSWTVASDERLKENIVPADAQACIDFIDGIAVKTFNYIGSDVPCMGVIAQDIQESELAKFFVSAMDCPEKYLAVRASDMVFPLILAVQNLRQRVAELEEKLR